VHGQKTGVDGRMGDHYTQVWKPVITAVNGWAAGAGLYILLASTRPIAAVSFRTGTCGYDR
jgi:enoyl-CoA hydratase/carnithine racemase